MNRLRHSCPRRGDRYGTISRPDATPVHPRPDPARNLVRSCSIAARKRGSRIMNFIKLSAALGLAFTATSLAANPMVGGAAMYSTRNIVQNAVNSKDHTTLVAAVKAGGLVDTLSGKGPFTVFAPTNAAFGKLPAGTVDTFGKPENKPTLTRILTYHVVPGRLAASSLTDGKKLKTVE